MGKAYVRRYPRLSVRLPVDCSAGEKGIRRIATTLGGGGLFLTNVEGLEPGQEISVRFHPARHLPIIQAKARVLYILAEEGAGLEFTEINPVDRHTLLRLIHQKMGDRRVGPRAPLATQIECDKCMSLAFSRNLSLGGMFIETTDPPPEGSLLTVRFNLDQKDRVVTASAQVVYNIEKMGMGVLFMEIKPQDRDAIRAYVESAPTPADTESARSQLAP
ncbi:MAG TPA: PilZ domain-containing protein [Terriglobia bacterium]|nr:PilZ domain-containing protein [Terriglobia bacterium]